MLRIVFIGDYELGAAVLGGALESPHAVVGVVHAMPDRGSMRWRRRLWNFFSPDDTARLVRERGLPVLSSRGANSAQLRAAAERLAPDVILMSSWGEILGQPTVRLARLACVNCHPSLLPAHRGVDPCSSVIVEGETRTGVTFHLVEERIDAGAILMQEEIDVAGGDTPATLRARCAYRAKRMVGRLLDGLERGELVPRAQDEAKASAFPRYRERDGEIDWTRPARELGARIRGLTPGVACFTAFDGRRLEIGSGRVLRLDAPEPIPGRIVERCGNHLLVATGDPEHGLLVEIVDDVRRVGFFNKARAHRFMDRRIRAGSLLDVSRGHRARRGR